MLGVVFGFLLIWFFDVSGSGDGMSKLGKVDRELS